MLIFFPINLIVSIDCVSYLLSSVLLAESVFTVSGIVLQKDPGRATALSAKRNLKPGKCKIITLRDR